VKAGKDLRLRHEASAGQLVLTYRAIGVSLTLSEASRLLSEALTLEGGARVRRVSSSSQGESCLSRFIAGL
jgi:hypothetical protein